MAEEKQNNLTLSIEQNLTTLKKITGGESLTTLLKNMILESHLQLSDTKIS